MSQDPEVEAPRPAGLRVELAVPEEVDTILKSPAPAAVAMVDGADDKPLAELLCALVDRALRLWRKRLPWWLPSSVVRTAIRRLFGCSR